MSQAAAFRSFAQMMTAALLADGRHCSATEALEVIQESASYRTHDVLSRRDFLLRAGATGAALSVLRQPNQF
jgi:hypothetical protein